VNVTVVDRVLPGDPAQASYGNAGILAFASFRPIAEPGLWWQGAKMLFQEDNALSVPWHYRAKITPWLLKLLRESSRKRSDENARATADLNAYSMRCWQDLINELSLQSFIKPTGWLKLFETDQAFKTMDKQRPVLEQFGLTYETLTAEQVYDIEPALKPGIRHGFMQRQSLSIVQPSYLLRHITEHLKRLGVVFKQANVLALRKTETGFELDADTNTNKGTETLMTNRLTLCGGAWAQRLLASLGCKFPLETERGYHLMLQGNSTLKQPVFHVEKQIALSPMSEGLRMTTGEELAGLDAKPDYNIIERKLVAVADILQTSELTVSSRWLGFRPSLPDSKPIISCYPAIPGLTLAFGHGHLGMTQSAATGQLLAQIIMGEKTDIDCTPFRPDRF
jgi:D-amino-acid dehydrogenase